MRIRGRERNKMNRTIGRRLPIALITACAMSLVLGTGHASAVTERPLIASFGNDGT